MHARSLLRCHTTLALVRGASAVVLALLGFAGQAACIPIADPRLAQYESLLRVNPAAAETQALAHLADRTLDRKTLASLYEILAQAYSIQEKHDDVRRAVQNGIALVQDVASPTYVNFVYLDTSRTLDEQEVAAGLKRAQAAHARQVKGSAEEACVLIALGVLEHVADRTDLASMHLTRAYRMSAGPERRQQRMLAAGVLSIVMQALRDFPAALALSREVIAWHTQRNSTIELSAAYFIEGYVLTEMGDRAAARVALKRSRDMSVQLKDAIGVAYADLNLCLNEIDLGVTHAARGYCDSAIAAFTAAALNEPLKQALTALAEVELLEGNPSQALAHLNAVLDQDGRDLPPFRLAQIYELRGRARRQLGQYQGAIEDYENYMRRFRANKEDERAREATAMRARFETDREIERNEFLQRELQGKSERLAAQTARLHWMIATAAASAGGIVLLTFLLLANRKKKRLLARLAQEDELTGLPNRRYTLQSASVTFQSLRKRGTPLTIGVLDLDHFKRINDRFGHAAGDYVLKEFARVARERIRGSDIVGRWGGEEFLIVLPDTPLDVALTIVERIRNGAAEITGGPLPPDFAVTLSAGIATNQVRSASLEEIIAQADAALYVAKNRGRNLVQVAQESYDASPVVMRKTLQAAGVELKTGKFQIAS